MPEFILDHGDADGARAFQALDSFTQGYIEALFFTDTGTGDDVDLEHATFADLAPETLESIKADCAKFQADNSHLWANEGADDDQAGRDFWFTRNRHGVGFWDRGDDVYSEAARDALTAACDTWRGYDVYAGDDGRIYLT